MKNIKKIIIIIILGLTLILTGLIILNFKPQKKTNALTINLKDIVSNMTNASSYNLKLYMKEPEKSISVTGNIRKTKEFNYFRGLIYKDSETQPIDIEYIFELAEQRYKQNIYYENNLLASNIYGGDESSKNIDLIDPANILSHIVQFLNDENTVCDNDTCKLNLLKDQKIRLALSTTVITSQELYSYLEKQEKVEVIFKLENKKKEIQAIKLITSKDVSINLEFDSFKF